MSAEVLVSFSAVKVSKLLTSNRAAGKIKIEEIVGSDRRGVAVLLASKRKRVELNGI